jgi:hypothetical protein
MICVMDKCCVFFEAREGLDSYIIFREVLASKCWCEYLDLRWMKLQDNGGSCTVRSFVFCTHPQISLGHQIKGNEVGGTCGTHGRGMCTGF